MATNPKHVELSDAVDDVLLDVIKNGQTATDAEGNVILDAENKPVRVTPSAAMINAAIKRLQNLGVTKEVTPTSTTAKLADAIRDRKLRLSGQLPPIPEEDENAA